MPPRQFVVNWSNGKATLQNGDIYVSPNTKRNVIIPSDRNSDPFKGKNMSVRDQRQPIWWSRTFGWRSFYPLSPSFLAYPFKDLCYQPSVVETSVHFPNKSRPERRFQMRGNEMEQWQSSELQLVRAAWVLQTKFAISGATPPLPSSFGFTRAHKSSVIAHKMITISRDWFGIWMGFISFLIARTEVVRPTPKDQIVPNWYMVMKAEGFSEAWLSGLESSTAVCSFSPDLPRAGIVLELSRDEPSRPEIAWFHELDIPMWFIWTRHEEEFLSSYPNGLRFLVPPGALIQDALTLVFKNPSSKLPKLPLAALVFRRYARDDNLPIDRDTIKVLKMSQVTSDTYSLVADFFLEQVSNLDGDDTSQGDLLASYLTASNEEERSKAEAEAALPYQSMIEKDPYHQKLVSDMNKFFEARQLRQKEIERSESDCDRQSRQDREANPPIKDTTMYTWDRITTSGGVEVYARLRVPKKCNEDTYFLFPLAARRYNACFNEWDFSDEFAPPRLPRLPRFDASDDEDDNGSNNYDSHVNHSPPDMPNNGLPFTGEDRPPSPSFGTFSSDPPSKGADSGSPADVTMDAEDPDNDPQFLRQWVAKDLYENLHLVYGYVSVPLAVVPQVDLTLAHTLLTLGFSQSSLDSALSNTDMAGPRFFVNSLITNPRAMPADHDDLNDLNLFALIRTFDLKSVVVVSSNLYVFHVPRSSACQWSLGVHSPTVAIYVCRLISSRPSSTILSVAHELLRRCVPFRTLVSLPSQQGEEPISKRFVATTFRQEGYSFTKIDFESALLHSEAILNSPAGRVALLRGGILGRLAQEFISPEAALSGPSQDVLSYGDGFVVASERAGYSYWDDELTENEIAIICGTCLIYTGKFVRC